MSILLTIIHVLACVFLILVVLLQTGKRADLAGAFGGGGSQTAFGPRGAATWLSKATTGAAVVFMLTSISLAVVSSNASRGAGSVLDAVDSPAAVTEPAPADAGEGAEGTAPAEPAPAEGGDASGDAGGGTEEPTP